MAHAAQDTPPSRKNWIHRHRLPLLIGGPLLLAAAALYLYLNGGRYVSTNDAYLRAARVEISANVSGRVVAVAVHDNQVVHAGDVLFRLDPRPFHIAVDAARARLAAARLRVKSLQATYLQRRADEKAAAETLAYQRKELAREKKLAESNLSSARELDRQKHALQSARQALTAARQQTASAFADLGGNPHAPVDSHPGVQQALAALDQARLNLSYAVVHAPIDGVVAKVEQLQTGDYIKAAAPLFALVSQKDMWVEANFKETDMTHIHAGQSASISVDAFPGVKYTGKVASTSPGTGADFSLLPPENSSGNWVKVVQRVPVRISINRPGNAMALAAGMSVTAEVDTEYHRSLLSWHRR